MPSTSSLRLLTPQEFEVMKIVWEAPTVTVRDVYEAMRRRRKIAYTTILTVMQTLEKKGYLVKSTAERQHVYRAKRPRSHTVGVLLKDFVDRVFNGSAKPLLVHLLAKGHLSKAEVEELRGLLEPRR